MSQGDGAHRSGLSSHEWGYASHLENNRVEVQVTQGSGAKQDIFEGQRWMSRGNRIATRGVDRGTKSGSEVSGALQSPSQQTDVSPAGESVASDYGELERMLNEGEISKWPWTDRTAAQISALVGATGIWLHRITEVTIHQRWPSTVIYFEKRQRSHGGVDVGEKMEESKFADGSVRPYEAPPRQSKCPLKKVLSQAQPRARVSGNGAKNFRAIEKSTIDPLL
ncbi:hypothetical protein K438DRAFT_1766239 [Mycena galopus ATCC 62051]|nr:hypothetical protein K438DRAFT_1766239 [Mycena galopus ATCC 62051]